MVVEVGGGVGGVTWVRGAGVCMHSPCCNSERHVVKSLPCGWGAWLCVNKERIYECLCVYVDAYICMLVEVLMKLKMIVMGITWQGGW